MLKMQLGQVACQREGMHAGVKFALSKHYTYVESPAMSSASILEYSSSSPQTVQPRGWLGRVTGWAMNVLNRKMNRLAIQQMKLGLADRVLEIGCGAGEALRLVLEETVCQQAAGVDCSAEMIDESIKKNQASIDSGALELKHGQVENLPWPDKHFTHAFAISNFHIWKSREAGLNEIRRVLKSGGKFYLCLRRERAQPRWYDQPGVTSSELAEDLLLFRSAGFIEVEQIEIPSRQPLVLIIAENN
jgi:SAM-dependent methyltransferase